MGPLPYLSRLCCHSHAKGAESKGDTDAKSLEGIAGSVLRFGGIVHGSDGRKGTNDDRLAASQPVGECTVLYGGGGDSGIDCVEDITRAFRVAFLLLLLGFGLKSSDANVEKEGRDLPVLG